MCIRVALAFVVVLCGWRAASAESLQRWEDREDAILVVCLLDGLVDAFVGDQALDGQALMPRAAGWTRQARRYADVLMPTSDRGAAREELVGVLAGFGAGRIHRLSGDDPGLEDELRELASLPGRQVVLIDLDWLTPPFVVGGETLSGLDPAPWSSTGSLMHIEDQVERRRRDARRMSSMAGRSDTRGPAIQVREARWLVRAAHREVDARLGSLLEVASEDALAERVALVLTATSSTGWGARGWRGLHRGTALDVVRVPFYLRLPQLASGVDERPHAWLRLWSDGFDAAPEAERFTWAWSEGAGSPAVCEMRWTTEGFTLIDPTIGARRARLFDLALDPAEWLDRGIAYPALADSLRRELRARLYGEFPTLVVTAGEQPLVLEFGAGSSLEPPPGRSLDPLRMAPGEVVRLRMTAGPQNISLGSVREWWIGEEIFVLQELLVHSPAWRAACRAPDAGAGPRLRIEPDYSM